MLDIRKGCKKSVFLKLALTGLSGFGKTFSSLRIATGMAQELNQKILLLDTEFGSGELYADLFNFDYLSIGPPYSPQAFIDIFNEVERLEYGVLIIDSISHEWDGEGGVLQIAESANTSRNPFGGWGIATPLHNQFINKLLRLRIHTICTIRQKTAYEVGVTNGKASPMKVGLGLVQKNSIENEFTILFSLFERGRAMAEKDRTMTMPPLTPIELDDTVGQQLIRWSTNSEQQLLESLCSAIEQTTDLSELRVCYEDSLNQIHSWVNYNQAKKILFEKKEVQKLELEKKGTGNALE